MVLGMSNLFFTQFFSTPFLEMNNLSPDIPSVSSKATGSLIKFL